MPESVICSAARARGAACVDVDGSTVAADYGDAGAEHRALREDVAIVDLAYRQRLRATGEDRVTFLQGMLTNDVAGLADGAGCHALLLNEQGRVVADVVALVQSDAILLDGVAP